MEIKTEADDIDEGVSLKDIRPLSASLAENHPSRWSSPAIKKKLRAAVSFNKHLP
jgi:transient receptor potential cation channel subfamily A member 1